MATCPACDGDVRDPAALLCPYCGAGLAATETRAAVTLTDTGTRDISPAGPDVEIGPIDDARFAPGRLFASRFRIVSLLGRGAMGEVYRAEDLKLGQQVALKLLSSPAGRGNGTPGRFASEVRLARGIVHPNVCRVFDLGEADGWHYLSMEYVDGETLASVRQRIGRLPPEKALDVARQLCAGIGAAHEHGVLHRDLKPSNIMLDGRGRVRIMDFGLAMRAGDPGLEIAGTPAYMAPEQLTGAGATARSDLYALGLVLYEIFTGTRVFQTRTFADRASARVDLRTLPFRDGVDPGTAAIVRTCLSEDPDERPPSAAHVAARLPGGDAIAAALAEGRVLPPDIVAAAATTEAMSPSLAWTSLVLIVCGLLLVAAAGAILTVTPAEMPKPPEVLAERAAQILSGVGHGSDATDREFWFDAATEGPNTRGLRFFYRESPQQLIPQNLFHFVTSSDPPMDVAGMASVTLDLSGSLVMFARIAPSGDAVTDSKVWATLFGDAGLAMSDFEQALYGRRPLVPHDSLLGWTPRRQGAPAVSVSAATLAGMPVYFEVVDPRLAEPLRLRVLSTRRSAGGEAALWVFVITIFTATIVMVRGNLRAGEGDLQGAWRLAVFVVCGGVLSTSLHAHHVPNPIDELLLHMSILGWALVWGGFSWLSYVAFEPHVRRLLPRTIISWTRVLSGRIRDPLVGRDVLAGVLAGVVLAGASVLRAHIEGHGPPDAVVALAIDSLRSPRHLLSRVIFAALDGLQYALGGFFVLVFLRLALKRMWLATIVLVALSITIADTGGTAAGILYATGGASLFFLVVLRLGLLSGAVMLTIHRLLTRIPLTLDFDAWYADFSAMVLLLVLALAVWGFRAATAAPRGPVPLPG